MAHYPYNGPEQFRPLSPWAYFGYGLLFAVPLIGLIFLVIYAFDDSQINRRNYARSYFCGIVFALIVFGVIMATGFAAGLFSAIADGIRV